MLENSYNIRANSEKLVTYSASQDWKNYALALGAIVKDLIYFKFDIDSTLNPNADPSSPYYEDTDGILKLKPNFTRPNITALPTTPAKKSKAHQFEGHWEGQPGDHPLVQAKRPRVQ